MNGNETRRVLWVAVFTVFAAALVILTTWFRRHESEIAQAPPSQPAGEGKPEDAEAPKVVTYKDPATGILLYVENDGRHVAAIDPEGKILWHRDVTADVDKARARGGPVAVHALGAPGENTLKVMKESGKKGDYAAVLFLNAKDGGVLDLRTGAYTFIGKD